MVLLGRALSLSVGEGAEVGRSLRDLEYDLAAAREEAHRTGRSEFLPVDDDLAAGHPYVLIAGVSEYMAAGFGDADREDRLLASLGNEGQALDFAA